MPEMIRASSFKNMIDEVISIYPILSDTPETSILKLLARKGLEKIKEEAKVQQSLHNAPITQQLLKKIVKKSFKDVDVIHDTDSPYKEYADMV